MVLSSMMMHRKLLAKPIRTDSLMPEIVERREKSPEGRTPVANLVHLEMREAFVQVVLCFPSFLQKNAGSVPNASLSMICESTSKTTSERT